ncbi:maleylpyruvate isomerase family mycothiol-dependent enzyme [Cryptosporangium phraense]|uniref:Maleylpyruvate isomerase family mycothiol-dependent enzyme n=1 Tax=Cryptosporangium phraense TaxID=2593070 RepID=A0A545AY20_9ACTN|nr:maleylpyruvate isomerase family mycothiol-dependent enzyme [Cryptosporangium phraense]
MDYAMALVEQDRLFADQLAGHDWSAPVPTCPGWTLNQLLRHLGRGHRWAAQIVRERRDEALDPRQVEGGKPPADEPGALGWLRDSGRALLAAVEATGPRTPVWTFLGPKPAGWWIRRRLHETTVHRADVAIALDTPYELAPGLAADAISEWIDLIVAETGPGQRGSDSIEPGVSLHLHATDTDAEWTLRGGPDGVTCVPEHVKSTTALRGPASELLLAITGRRPATEIHGDESVWHQFLERTPL